MKSIKSLMAVAVTALIFFSCQKNGRDFSQIPSGEATSAFRMDPNLEKLLKNSDIEEVFIQSTINLDPKTGNITLPLFKGQHKGQTVWYIVTEASDKKNAARLGVNFAPKMANALGTAAVQHARLINGTKSHPAASGLSSKNAVLDFDGTVDFSPQRIVVPGPDGFPPARFQAGAVGDAKYSPMVTFGDGVVLNASHVANASGLHDAVISIDYNKRQVTLDQFFGFYEDQKILYLHQEGSIELVAAIEGSTFAPNLNAAPLLGSDAETSARSAIIPIVNGERGVNNPNRQGLQSALLGEGDPLNVTQEEPGDDDYTPIWDIHLVVWTDAAINAGKRRLLTDHEMIADLFQKGLLVSGTPNSGVANPSLKGLVALGAISNCPISAIFEKVE
jgi:hypothetical protein